MVEVFKFREVQALFTARLPDSADSDQLPDRVPLNGYGTLRPNIRGTSVVFTEVGEFAVPRTRQVAFVDGELMVEVVDGESSILQPLFLEVTVDERANQAWSWTLTFDSLTIGEWGEEISHPALSFPVEDGEGPLELSTVATTVTRTANFVTRGVRGHGIDEISVRDGGLIIEYADGKSVVTPIPTGAEINDPQVAAVVSTGPQTVGALDLAYRRSVSVIEYGADQTAADNTAAFQSAVDDLPAGGELFIPPGTYAFDDPYGVTIPSGVHVKGNAATLTTSRNAPLLNVAAGADRVTVESITVHGNMPVDLVATIQNQAGIAAYSDAAAPITNLTVKDCEFVGVQGTAIRCRNVRDFRILNNSITHHGYAAIGCHSVSNGIIEGNRVEGTRGLPAYAANSYGIYVSTLESAGPVGSAENPRSTDVLVRNNTVMRQAWSALDTHVGKRISFIGNLVHDCPAYAINCVYIATSGADGALAPQDVLVENNTITYEAVMDDSNLLHMAILFRGSIDFANPNRERVTGIVRGNVIRRMGRQDDSNSSAIFVASALGAVVQGNTIHECRSSAIQVRDSIGTVVDSNTFVDVWRTSGQAAGVYIRISEDIVMDVTITGNKFVRGSLVAGVDIPAGASINTNGITGSTDSRIVTVEANNEWGNAAMANSQVRTKKGTGSQTIMLGTAPPTGPKPDGRPWIVGDQVENSSPAPGSPMGWVCASGGAPGVWRAFGSIAA